MKAHLIPRDSQMAAQRDWSIPCFITTAVLLFCSVLLLFFAVMPWPPPTASTFWVATQPILVGEQATMTHMKAQIFLFHMSPNSYIFIGEIVLFKAQSKLK